MSKFTGVIGYATHAETSPGVWQEVITERHISGDVLQDQRRWENNEALNAGLIMRNKFSVVLGRDMAANVGAMRYLTYEGTRWSITSFEIVRPRIVITVGGVYNGPNAT